MQFGAGVHVIDIGLTMCRAEFYVQSYFFDILDRIDYDDYVSIVTLTIRLKPVIQK